MAPDLTCEEMQIRTEVVYIEKSEGNRTASFIPRDTRRMGDFFHKKKRSHTLTKSHIFKVDLRKKREATVRLVDMGDPKVPGTMRK